MPIAIKMRGELEPSVIEDSDFQEVVQGLQMAKMKGMEFMILDKDDGFKKAFYLPNLSSIEEFGEDAF